MVWWLAVEVARILGVVRRMADCGDMSRTSRLTDLERVLQNIVALALCVGLLEKDRVYLNQQGLPRALRERIVTIAAQGVCELEGRRGLMSRLGNAKYNLFTPGTKIGSRSRGHDRRTKHTWFQRFYPFPHLRNKGLSYVAIRSLHRGDGNTMLDCPQKAEDYLR